jgi:hypothetical protein
MGWGEWAEALHPQPVVRVAVEALVVAKGARIGIAGDHHHLVPALL